MVFNSVFKSQAMSFYGCELFNLDDPYINKLLTAWRVCSRRILNVHRQTHCNLIEPLIQCKNPLLMIEQRSCLKVVGIKINSAVIPAMCSAKLPYLTILWSD